MRKIEDECSFVSFRDVECCVKVFRWFYEYSVMFLVQLNVFFFKFSVSKNYIERDFVFWLLMLVIGVCYYVFLEKKDLYWKVIVRFFLKLYDDSRLFLDEIIWVQDFFLDGVFLRKIIVKNLVLKENVFMMVVCIELKIFFFFGGEVWQF